MKTIAEQLFGIPRVWYDRVLFIDHDNRLTFGQARAMMLQIAAWLIEMHGVESGDKVALCLPMSVATVQVVLGVLAAGASYLPLQYNGPPERLSETLASFKPDFLLTTEAMAQKITSHSPGDNSLKIIALDPDSSRFSRTFAGTVPLEEPVQVDTEAMAAVFFTSGSTGEPKGIVLSYRSMAEAGAIFPLDAPMDFDDRAIMSAPSHYAASLEFTFPLFVGCSIYIATEQEAMFSTVIADILERERITVWVGATSRLRFLLETVGLEQRDLRAIRLVAFYGERAPMQALRAGMGCFPNALFQNSYDASEAHWMMSFDIPRPLPEDMESVPIGKPRKGYTLVLCDAEGAEVPPGEVGEICVIGPVALTDYWKRPDLTAAARLNGIPNSYRTGDLARLSADGNCHFVGRRDHQVKIRGHRFELGEIEAVLKLHASVREAVAFLVADKVHVCVLAANRDGLEGEIRALCVRKLPAFARPTRIAVLEQFPHLTSGKVDRMKLERLC